MVTRSGSRQANTPLLSYSALDEANRERLDSMKRKRQEDQAGKGPQLALAAVSEEPSGDEEQEEQPAQLTKRARLSDEDQQSDSDGSSSIDPSALDGRDSEVAVAKEVDAGTGSEDGQYGGSDVGSGRSDDEDQDATATTAMIKELGGGEDVHQGLRYYVSRVINYEGKLLQRAQQIIRDMIRVSSSLPNERNWNRPILPMHTFLRHFNELDHPWVEVDTNVRATVWLFIAVKIYAYGGMDHGPQLYDFLQLYEDVKTMEILEDVRTMEILEDAISFLPNDWQDNESLDNYIRSVREGVWRFAPTTANWRTIDDATRTEIATVFNQHLADYFDNGRPLGSPARLLWDILWDQVWQEFQEWRLSTDAEAGKFQALWEGAYQAAHLHQLHRFPPLLDATMQAEDVCDKVDGIRERSVSLARDQWALGNTRAHQESQNSFQDRFDRFEEATSADPCFNWGYGPLDDVEDFTISYSIYRERLNDRSVEDEVRAWARELHLLRSRFDLYGLEPYWRHDQPARNWVFSDLQKALYAEARAAAAPRWEAKIADAEARAGQLRNFSATAADLRAYRDQEINEKGIPFGPTYAALAHSWRMVRMMVPDTTDTVTKERIKELHILAKNTAWRYEGDCIFPLAWKAGESASDYCARLSPYIWSELWGYCEKAWRTRKSEAEDAGELASIEKAMEKMERMRTKYGRFYRPLEDRPAISRESRDGDVLMDLGGGAFAPEGHWGFLYTAGQGSFGHAGVWAQYNNTLGVIAKIVIKETYLRTDWNVDWPWLGARDRRIPLEYHLVSRLNTLSDSFNIIRYIGYGIYEELKMHRIYMELCQHGSLADVAQLYYDLKVPGYKDRDGNPINWKIPPRMLWAIFEALTTALYLMQEGVAPPAERELETSVLQQVVHRDIKPLNIFMAAPSEKFWRGIPTAKLGDFGNAVAITSENLQALEVGTQGYQAPEHLRYAANDPEANHGFEITTASDTWVLGKVMLDLMNVTGGGKAYPFGSDPEIPPFQAGVEAYYPAELCRLVRSCLEPIPFDRPGIVQLWKEVHGLVASFVGLTGTAMKDLEGGDGEVLQFPPESYLLFTAPAAQ